MPNLPISGLTASATSLTATDVLPVTQTTGVGPVKMTGQQLATGLLGSTTLSGATVTADAPVLNLSQTWNNAGVTFTGLKANFTDTASASASLLLDLQVGGTSKFYANKSGSVFLRGSNLVGDVSVDATGRILLSATSGAGARINGELQISANDLFLTRRAAANLRLGAADAASPVAQTLSVQSVSAGQTNVAGANLTITGSQGTGSGAGGSIVFQVAPAGASGTAQNALATALTINSASQLLFAGSANAGIFKQSASDFVESITGFSMSAGGSIGCSMQQGGFFAGSSATIGFTSGNGIITRDTILARDAANTLALRNGTAAQTFNVYNTYTSGTNYERFTINAQSGAAVLIGTNKGSGGGTARALELQTDGTTRLTIGSGGGVTFADAQNIAVGTTTGTQIATATNQKIGFFGATPVVQGAEITDELTTITFTAPGTPDYAISNLVDSAGGSAFGFASADEGNSVLAVIANLQARVNDLESRLVTYGLLADAD